MRPAPRTPPQASTRTWSRARDVAGGVTAWLDHAGADARVLALLRMGAALLVLADLGGRLGDFHAFYTAPGLVPAPGAGARWSLLALGDGAGPASAAGTLVPLFGFLLALVAAALVLVGYHTRAALVAMFVMLVSVQHRNPSVGNGGDAVLCALVFWLTFTDAGACWSLDQWRRRAAAPPAAVVAAAPVRVLQLQIAAIYLVAFLTKTGSTWRDGSAVERVLGASDWARGLGPWLGSHPTWCRALTYATLVIEGAFAPLVLLPVRRAALRRLRWAALLAGLALHLGIFFTMRIGVFSLVMPLSYLAFLATPPLAAPPLAAAPPRTPPMLAWGLLAAFGLVMTGQLTNLLDRALPRALAAPLELFGLRQDWRMFAPEAPTEDVRFVAPGRFADGHTAELTATSLAGLGQHRGFVYSRWHRLRNALANHPPRLLQALGRFACAREPGLVSFELWAEVTPVVLGDGAGRPSRRELRLHQDCQAGAPPQR